eukprot:6187264-Pleurochrysis_carterae.AAC.2
MRSMFFKASMLLPHHSLGEEGCLKYMKRSGRGLKAHTPGWLADVTCDADPLKVVDGSTKTDVAGTTRPR